MNTFTLKLRTLALSAVVAAAVCWVGCGGGEDNPSGGNSGNDNTVVRGTFTDSRDGTVYKTVKIGRQTWMAENLNRETPDSYCYNNIADSCAKYGRLYSWRDADTACPSGWRLPDTADWNLLEIVVGGRSVAGKALKSTSGWKYSDNDSYGFAALPGGYGINGNSFYYGGSAGYWWTATEYSSFGGDYINAYSRNMENYYGYDDLYENTELKRFDMSVRCIAN